jgi:hypothetical protein
VVIWIDLRIGQVSVRCSFVARQVIRVWPLCGKEGEVPGELGHLTVKEMHTLVKRD